MKKLLAAVLLLSALQLGAQNRHTLSLVAGPNWLQQFSGVIIDGPYFRAQTGWGAGLDYQVGITKRCDVKLGLRYHKSVSVYENNDVIYASEFSTGVYVYDSTLTHSIRIEYPNKAWQYLLGTRLFFSPLKTWRWYLDGEIGLTSYEQRQTASRPAVYLTGGLGFGVQWLPPEKQFGVFIQPVFRYATSFGRNDRSDPFLIPAIEVGVRAQFFTAD